VDLDPQRGARPLVDLDDRGEAAPGHLDHRRLVVDEHPPLDEVAGHGAVHGQDLVALDDAGAGGR
jgi:hypothetical protein